MKKNLFIIMAIAALVMQLSSSGPLFACMVGGDFNAPGTSVCAAEDLWTLLQSTGGGIYTPTLPSPLPPYSIQTKFENYTEGDLVLVTGKKGSSALYSVGELDTKYAQANAVTLTLDWRGRYDLTGEGRAVEDISDIDVVHAVNVIKGQTLHFYSSRLVVSGDGTIPKTFDLVDLQGMEQATYTNTSGADWSGPTLLSVLNASGVNTEEMNSYIVVSATDGYATVLSMYEVTHMTGSQNDLLAISASDGSINGTTASDSGFARLILPGDKGAGRWVSNVDNIAVYKLPCKETFKAHWHE